MKLHEGGVYLVNGTELISEGPEASVQISAKTGAAAVSYTHLDGYKRQQEGRVCTQKSIGAAGYQAVGFIADFLKEYS